MRSSWSYRAGCPLKCIAEACKIDGGNMAFGQRPIKKGMGTEASFDAAGDGTTLRQGTREIKWSESTLGGRRL